MKKVTASVVALGVLATVACSLAVEVKSVNVVGFAKKTVEPGKFYIMANNFNTMQGNNTLLDIFGTNTLAQSGVLGLCDKIMIWDPIGSTYQRYAQYEDGVFYLANSQAQFNMGIVSNPVVQCGQSFWLAVAPGTSKEISLMGEVLVDATNSVPLVAGFQMISYPFSTGRGIQDTALAASAAKSGVLGLCDKLIVWDPDGGYQRYAPYTDGVWYLANSQAQFNNGIVATNSLVIGEGFWYQAINSHSWNESNPYLSNL